MITEGGFNTPELLDNEIKRERINTINHTALISGGMVWQSDPRN